MAVTSFLSELWSARLLTTLNKGLVYSTLFNRDYEGEITREGDTVHILTLTNPTVAAYTRNSTTITPEELTTADSPLLIDQAQYFGFYVDDVDARQAAGSIIGPATTQAAYKLRDVADQYLAGLHVNALAGNEIGATAVTTGDGAYDALRQLQQKLDENNVPQDDRHVVVPPWFRSLLLDNAKFTDASAYGNPDAIQNGMIGTALGMTVHMSNNAPTADTGDDSFVIAAHPMAGTYAEQIVSVEAYRPESSFSDAVKGLHVYGAKIIRPEAIATFQASQSAVV